MMIGNDEKSMGLAVSIATIMISSARIMLNVKKISNIKGGIGRTRRVNTNSTNNGVTNELRGKILAKCRKFVSVKKDAFIRY